MTHPLRYIAGMFGMIALLSALVFGVVAEPVYAQSAQQRLCEGAGGSFSGGECVSDQGVNLFNDSEDNPSIFQRVADILLFITGAVSVIMLIIGGFRYVISNGDPSAVESAKNTILYAIIGLIVTFLAFAAVRFVVDRLTG